MDTITPNNVILTHKNLMHMVVTLSDVNGVLEEATSSAA